MTRSYIIKRLYIVVLVAFIIWTCWAFSRVEEAALWPHVKGNVVSTKLDIKYLPNLVNTKEILRWYGADVRYEYTIGDKRYSANRVSFADKDTRKSKDALKVINRYRKQGEPVVYYDPKDPKKAVLERWGIMDTFVCIMGAGLLLILGLLVFLFEDRKESEKRLLSEIPKLIFRDKYGNLIRS